MCTRVHATVFQDFGDTGLPRVTTLYTFDARTRSVRTPRQMSACHARPRRVLARNAAERAGWGVGGLDGACPAGSDQSIMAFWGPPRLIRIASNLLLGGVDTQSQALVPSLAASVQSSH